VSGYANPFRVIFPKYHRFFARYRYHNSIKGVRNSGKMIVFEKIKDFLSESISRGAITVANSDKMIVSKKIERIFIGFHYRNSITSVGQDIFNHYFPHLGKERSFTS